MLLDITAPASFDEPLPPPAWLVGGIVATVIFAAAALVAAVPHDRSDAPTERVDTVLHADGIASVAKPHSLHAEPSIASIVEFSKSSPTPFDPINLSLPLL